MTAIASDPQQNIAFYTDILGLRLVKITVNYDDPGSYHFYYGDTVGSPGSILTFFSWSGGMRGRTGTGQATVTAFSVPEGSLDYWQKRFEKQGVPYEKPAVRWEETALRFRDPDGMVLELVAHPDAELRSGWTGGSVSADAALRGFHSVTLSLRDRTHTAALLTETMGFSLLREEGSRSRYAAEGQGAASVVDLLTLPETPHGTVGVGNVHHVAWRTPTDAAQETWREQLTRLRYQVSPVMDRQYFHSIYFREPGGVLFEIATDTPGFTTDETLDNLGTRLCLPEWLEPHRELIQQRLPVLDLPKRHRRRRHDTRSFRDVRDIRLSSSVRADR